jgi:hypothetical protein
VGFFTGQLNVKKNTENVDFRRGGSTTQFYLTNRSKPGKLSVVAINKDNHEDKTFTEP